MTGVNEDVRVGNTIADDSLILLDGAKKQNDGVVGESEGLACFPGSEDGIFIDLVLRFGEDLDNGVSPRGIRARCIGLNDSFSFAGQLVKFIVVDALGEEGGVEGQGLKRVQRESITPGLVEQSAKQDVIVGVLIRMRRRAKAKTFWNGKRQESGVVRGLVPGGDKIGRLSTFAKFEEVRKLR